MFRWGHGSTRFQRDFVYGADLPLHVVDAAFFYGMLLAIFAPYSIRALLRDSNLSDWRVQPLKKLAWSWIRLAGMMPFM